MTSMMILALLVVIATAMAAAALVLWVADRVMRDLNEGEDDE